MEDWVMRFLLTTVCVTLFCAAVQAEEAATGGAEVERYTSMFNSADDDNDGRLDAAEAEAIGLGGASYASLDTDGDGTIDLDEFLALISAGSGDQ